MHQNMGDLNKNSLTISSVRVLTSMEQVSRIELPSQPWQGCILAVEPHLHYKSNITKISYDCKSFSVNK